MKTSHAIVAFVCIALSRNLCHALPFITGAQAAQHETALNLPEGCQLYVYGMATGGGFPSRPFAEGESVILTNASGNASAEISVTKDNVNSFTTDCGYYVIGGFGASGFRYAQGFYGANFGPGPNLQASVQFTLTAPAMVAVIGVGSSQTILTFSGVDPLTIDVPSPNGAGGTVALSIGHTYLGAGTYTFKETTGDGAPIQDPSHEVDLLGVLIFSDSPSTAKSDNPQIPLSLSSQPPQTPPVTISNTPPSPPSKPATGMPIARYVMLGIATLIFAAFAVAIIRMIIPRRHG